MKLRNSAIEDSRLALAQVDTERQLRVEAQETISKLESDLEALSGAYNSLEKVNLELESQLHANMSGDASQCKFYSENMINDIKAAAVEEKVEEIVNSRIRHALDEAKVKQITLMLP